MMVMRRQTWDRLNITRYRSGSVRHGHSKKSSRTAGIQVHDKHAGARDNDKHTNKVLMHQGRDGGGEVPLEALLNSSILYEGCAHIFENKEAQREYFEAPRVTTEDNC